MTEPDATPFIQLLRRRWWLILVGLVPTVLITSIGSSGQPPVYESTSTFVVRPIQTDAERVMRAMDTLIRGVEINTTFATIVGSRHVEDRAKERLALDDDQRRGLSIDGRVITGTSILEITAFAPEPELARDFAEVVAEETLTYINELDNGFGLAPLDPPNLPRSAAQSAGLLSTAATGMLGTVLGLGLVYASGQLQPLGGRGRFDIVDPVSGAYTREYFLKRLREEVARIDRSGGTLTVALLVPVGTVARSGLRGRGADGSTSRRIARALAWPGRVLRRLLGESEIARTADALRAELHDADVLAYLGDGRFAVLAFDRIAPALGPQLRSAQPTLALRVAETTYVGGQNGRGTLDDLPAVLQRLEEELANVTGSAGGSEVRHLDGEPLTSPWPVRR